MAELGSGSGSDYPGTLDTYNTTVANNVDDYDAAHMNDVNQAVIAVQGELGTDPAGSASTLAARIGVEHGADGTHSTITATSITSNLTDTDNIRIDGNTISSTDTNGSVTITPDGTGDIILDGQKWPQADGSARQALRTDGSGQLAYYTPITIDTPKATTSGTAVDFTGIPAGVKRIKVFLNDVSLSGTDTIQIQLGDAASFETTGYTGLVSFRSGEASYAGSGFQMSATGVAALGYSGVLTLDLTNTSNTWVGTSITENGTTGYHGTGVKSLTGEITRVRITRSGTDTFDAGSANITYE